MPIPVRSRCETICSPTSKAPPFSGCRVEFPRDSPETGLILVIGFIHVALHDVSARKTALSAHGLPFLSVPTAALDAVAGDLESVADAGTKVLRVTGEGAVWARHDSGTITSRALAAFLG